MTEPESNSDTPFASPALEWTTADDGVLLRSARPLGAYARCTGEYLERWARETPDRPFLLERAPNEGWRGPSYSEALARVYEIAGWLLGQNVSVERPVAILSQNSVEHALLTLACLHVGVPVAPISPAYSLVSKDFSKLRAIVATLAPGLIYAADAQRFGPALAAIRELHDATIVAGGAAPRGGSWLTFDALRGGESAAAVARAFACVTPDTIAKFLFTSGSTGDPKGVINTQRMLCSNQRAIAEIWPFVERAPVLVDWLPWHHTFGGNHNFNIVLCNGGTLYVDRGRPLPGEFEETLENLRAIAPTMSLNVPRAYDLLVAALRADAALCQRFFSRLRVIFYAGASLPQSLWEALRELARQTLGHEVPVISSWGLTETAPMATICHSQPDRSGVVGLPIPGCELKLLPNGDKLEAYVRGPNVTTGYFKRPDLTAEAFDEQGFFRTGDALRFVEPEHPERGLSFDGRLAENFKLSTATWVQAGALRVEAIAAFAPLAQDVVVAGHDRDEIGLLIFPHVDACRELCADLPSDASPARVLSHAAVRAHVLAGLVALDEASTGSSNSVRRALLMLEPPSIDAGEITDKGYVNQRAVLERRAALVDVLYREPPDATVVVAPPSTTRASRRPGGN